MQHVGDLEMDEEQPKAWGESSWYTGRERRAGWGVIAITLGLVGLGLWWVLWKYGKRN